MRSAIILLTLSGLAYATPFTYSFENKRWSHPSGISFSCPDQGGPSPMAKDGDGQIHLIRKEQFYYMYLGITNSQKEAEAFVTEYQASLAKDNKKPITWTKPRSESRRGISVWRIDGASEGGHRGNRDPASYSLGYACKGQKCFRFLTIMATKSTKDLEPITKSILDSVEIK